jgi:hypothetical protein
LVNPDTSVYCGILRDGYEAFAMYCFGRYITACLGEDFSEMLISLTTHVFCTCILFGALICQVYPFCCTYNSSC